MGRQAERLAYVNGDRVHQRSGRGVRRRDRARVRPATSTWSIRSRAGRRRSRPRSSSPGSTGSRPGSPGGDKIIGALAELSRQHAPRALRLRPRALQDLLSATGWSRSSGCRHPTRTAATAAASRRSARAAAARRSRRRSFARDPTRSPRCIAEPVGGSSTGASVPAPEYWRRVRAACDRHGVLLVADEVLTGAGRTGTWSALEPYGVVPDIMTLGEGHRRRIRAALGRGGPAAAGGRAGAGLGRIAACPDVLASCDALRGRRGHARYLREHALIERCAAIAPAFHARLAALRELPGVGDVRGRGLLAGVEFVADTGDPGAVSTRRPLRRDLRGGGARGRARGVAQRRPGRRRQRRPRHARAAVHRDRGRDRPHRAAVRRGAPRHGRADRSRRDERTRQDHLYLRLRRPQRVPSPVRRRARGRARRRRARGTRSTSAASAVDYGDEPLVDRSPIDTGLVLGRFAVAGPADVDRAVARGARGAARLGPAALARAARDAPARGRPDPRAEVRAGRAS